MKEWKTGCAWVLVTAMVLLAALSLSACGSKLYDTATMAGIMATAAYVMDAEEGQTDTTFLGENLNTLKAESGNGLFPSSDISSPADTGRRLTQDVNMGVGAGDLDDVFSQITDRVRKLGGYMGSFDVSGTSVNSYGDSQQRYADIKARISADRPDRSMETTESTGSVTGKQEQVTDVTLQYSDMQSRKKSVEIEQERLWAPLEKAEFLDVMVAPKTRFSEIRYGLESCTSQLRFYDNQVDYSTVSINMGEVKDLTPTAPDSIGTRVQKGFNQSLSNLGEAGADLIVWITSNNSILLILAIIAATVILFVRGLSRRMQGRLRFLSRSSDSRGKHMGKRESKRDRKVQVAGEQTKRAVEKQTENRKTLEEQTGKMQREKE